MPPRTSAMRSGAVTLVCKSNGSKVRTPDTTPLPELTRQKWFSDCGHVKWDSDLSVRGHGSLRCRVLRFKMVFGGGSSPMSFAGWASEPTPQPFLRDRSTSVPSGLRFPPSQRRKFRSGSGLLCPLIVRARFPDRQDQDCDLARCCDCGLSEPASSGQSHCPALQRNASPGGSSRTLPRTAVRASSRLRTSTPVPTNPFRQIGAALV